MIQFYPIQKSNGSFLTKGKVFFTKSILNKYSALLFVFAFFSTSSSFAQFPGNDNVPGALKAFNVPANVTHVNAAAWGAGGGGGGASGNNLGGNGGGGGGAASNQIAVSSGNSFTYTVGTSGAAGAAANGTGGNGTLSSITAVTPSTNLSANGGTGGLGGNVALGTPTNSGGGSASGGINSPGSDGARNTNPSGAGGNSGTAFTVFGAGATGVSDSTGTPGGQPGAGGSGGERNGGTNSAGGAGAPGRVMFDYITVSNVTPNPVCIGATITITGTNFSTLGTTTITVNGTACTSIVVVNTTTITAVVGASATSGVVDINNNGRRNNGRSITINPSPTIVTVTGTTPACTSTTLNASNGSSGTIYWQNTTSNGTSTATPSTSQIVSTSGTYYFRAQSAAGCWGPQGSIVVTINSTPTITANPANSSIAVGANTSFTVTASGTPTSYIWEVSTNGGGAWSTVTASAIYSNETTATLDITGATLSMSGYMYRAMAVNACGTSAASTAATLTVSLIYCTPSSAAPTTYPISNVTFAGINNSSSAATSAGPFYQDFSAISGSVIPNGTYTFSATATGVSPNPFGIYVFFDWNNNGDFTDDGGLTTIGTYTTTASGVLSASITIPSTAVIGSTVRMRVANQFNSAPSPCPTGGSFQDEDYTLNIIAGPACATPAAQPTALVLTPGGTFINGSFTAAAGADHYLVVINTTNVTPTPSNGTTYAIGDTTLGGTNVIVDIDNNTTFTAGQLNLSTTYYVFVFSYNSACTGGPLYRTVTPLNGPATTTGTLPTYCTPVTTSTAINRLYVSSVAFVGTLLDTSQVSTTDGVADGFQDFTGNTKSIQAQAGPINMKLTSDTGRGFWKVWVDWNKDGDFADSGEEVYNPGGYLFASTTFGFIVPANAAPGDYRMRVRVQNTIDTSLPVNDPNYETLLYFDSCNSFNTISGTRKTYGEAEDYLFTVIAKCDNKITSISNPAICGPGTATLSAIGTGTDVKWYDALTGGTLVGTTANGANFTPAIIGTTTYYITSSSVTCETLTRIPVIAEVKPVPALIIATPNVTICGENQTIQLDATGNNEVAYLIDENFEGGTLGVFSNVNSDGTTVAQKGQTAWKNKTSIFVPSGGRWFPAISSGFGTNKFVLTSMDDFKTVPLPTVDMENSLTLTTAVNPAATSFANLTLSLRMYYSRYFDDGASTALENCNIEISTNGGTTWPISLAAITADQGYGSNFVTLTYNLNAYIAQTNLKIRIRVLGDGSGSGTAGDGAAIDDVKLYGSRPLTPFFALGGGVNAYTDAATTITYTGDQRNTIWIKPTLTQLEQASFVINVSANLNNGCTTNGTINVTNQTKVWKGTIDNDWNKAGNWLPAVIPNATTCVIIPTGSTSQIMNTPDALAKNLTVKAPTGNLELQSGRNLTVTDWINVEAGATFNVRNSANLVQVTNAPVPANSGNINMERIANLRLQDYSYWSSPVGNAAAGTFPVTSVSTATPSGYIFKWGTTTVNPNGGQGYWINTAENMVPTTGYIVRGPNGFNNVTTTPLTANFIGVPSNGIFTPTIYRGTDFTTVGTQGIPRTATDDNWNLLGNPYPSSIGINEFLTTNAANLSGGVRLWTHGQLPTNATDPFYQNFVTNYYPSDYIAVNLTGATSGAGDVKIGSGQGFMVLMNAGAAGSNTVTFNNSMRSAAFANNVFYKNGVSANETAVVEKHRIWLDLVGANGNASRTLVGYIAGATQANDGLYDSFTDYKNSENFYSLIDTEIMQIQGRALPFENTDFVPMGFKTSVSGSHSIAIATVDGLFSDASQNILLEDKLLNTTHNLKDSPYTFTTAAGIFNDRFVLRYSATTLSNHDFDANTVKVFTGNNTINVTSTSKIIKEVVVYDVLGKTVINKTNINKQEISLNELKQTSTMLVVKVTLENNEVVVTKVIF
ncbi:IPT/TIG domain-containing protein [Flavobacterium swingsii]|uniref:IPT/TIG domain-containing protein n=1 Tax=Flavobacterium swingsii TaxID=498292 RepID=A0A1I0VHR4_9FLAO|nr:GEVED domain-containing protein [Flavobacterium swingsii]SFA75583.1 IPT/TIG domain-containing protein [Flavobacterium swingsii]